MATFAKAKAWFVQGFFDYARHFGSREFLRNNFNVTCIGGAIAVIDQIWINGRMTLPEVIRSRVIASVVDMAGAGDMTVSGHGEWLRIWNITPETPDWKRRAVEWPLMVIGVAAWNFGQYFLCRVSSTHYFRSVCISTVVGIVVQVAVLRANAILNDYATDDPKFRKNIPKAWSKFFGCEYFSARAKKRFYWAAIVVLILFMLANWVWGKKLRQTVFGH